MRSSRSTRVPATSRGRAARRGRPRSTADGRFAEPAELRAQFVALGVTEDTEVVCYCGSGVSACANLLALEHAGVTRTRLYTPSWSGWSADPERPAVVG